VPNFQIEKKFLKKGFKFIAGVDEVGRGALFGPVVAASVIFPSRTIKGVLPGWLKEVNDSKLLTPLKRRRLARLILNNVEVLGIGMATNLEIDQANIYQASLTAMRRAVENIPITPDVLLVDGFILKDVNYFQIGIPQGDRKSISIAAASIVAKVLRDEMMVLLNKVYGGYSLHKNKGYGTKEHFRALEELGPTPFHRLTFNLASKV
jgi:ribonuclease HII